jgi:dihydrofolate synthase / folylpolyglutamate synthase
MDTEYQQALDYIYSFVDFEKNMPQQLLHFDLRRVSVLLQRLGNPHLSAKTVHIAGTKGKGSVAAMVAAALTASGYNTGLYTSPHLHAYNERIRIDNVLITDADIVALVETLKPEVAQVNRAATYGRLTTFEITTALAFQYFRSRGADFQVIETGLGGRLDATNVVNPEVTVITSISLDHMEVLGDTLAKIAAEKAGIIKPAIPVVASPQPDEVDDVLEQTCQKMGSKLIRVGQDVTWEYKGSTDERQSLRVKGRLNDYDLTIPLLGRHQLDNASAAVAALEVLQEKGSKVTADSIANGLAGVEWPGRLQVLNRQPLLVVDGAHNGESAAKLRQALQEYFTFDQAVLIIGVSADKDLPGIISELAPVFDQVIATQSIHPRAMPAPVLVAELRRHGINALATGDVSSALLLARKSAAPGDLICVTGSLFVVADAINHVRNHAF